MTGVTLHHGLAGGRWSQLTLLEQLANIGSEVGRAARAKAAGNDSRLQTALERGLELFDLTITDERWHHRLRELCRAREVVCDFLLGDNEYGSTGESLDRYFLAFATAARTRRDLIAEVPRPTERAGIHAEFPRQERPSRL